MTPPSQLPDHAHRADIRSLLDRTLFVEAGAGSGKTSSLVERVVALLAGGATVDQLAVITFTEAAAAELRDRVRLALDEHDEPWARTAVADLDGAAISTLHGFAQRILTENPIDAGLPPIVEVHGEIGAQVEFERRWRAHLDVLLDDDDAADLVQRAIVLGIEIRHLRALAAILENEWDRIRPDHRWAPPELPEVSLEPILDPLTRVDDLARGCRDPDDKMLAYLDRLLPWRERAERATSDLERLDVLHDCPELKGGNVGRKGSWPDGALDEVRDLLRSAEAARSATYGSHLDEVLTSLVDNLCTFTMTGVAERTAAGQLQFHDLLVLCRRLLTGSTEVRRRLHDRYRHLLVDEFQDTDPIQIEITRLIATSVADVSGTDWRDLLAEPGRLFFVGDAKQSIYRFRRADIGLFLEVRQSPDTEPRVLSTNFRTVPAIVEWVNHTFTEIMGEGSPDAQPAYEPLHAHRDAGPGGVPVVVVGGPQEIRRAPDRRRAASDELARALRSVVDDGWQVDDGSGGWRPARWDDIAILIPARTGLPELRAALDAHDVPYRIEASSLVWLTQEVADLLAVLRAVDDPADELALLASLRSPGFACGDDDLARFVAAGGRIDLDRPTPPALPDDDPVVAALASLRALRAAAVWDEPSALVERVIRERHLMQLALTSARPRDVWRRLRYVADQARAYVDAEGGTLRDFLDWTDLQADETARVTESILPETDDVAVRVMTIHASKGLEFPVVALTGLDRRPHEKRGGPKLLWDGTRFEANLRTSMRTRGYAPLEVDDDAHEVHEAWRLMYVAATRARDHLLLCLHHDHRASPERSVAARLHEICARRPDLWRELELAPPSSPATSVAGPGPDIPVADLLAARADFVDERARLLARSDIPPVLAATAVATAARAGTELHGPEREPDEDHVGDTRAGDPDTEPWRRGRAGTSIGRAVHATLQTVDLATGRDLAAVAAAQAAAEGIPGRTAEVERSARAALEAPVVRAAAELPHWRELYVGGRIADVLCEGYLDLLVDGPDGLVVVDYKTDRAPDPAALVPRYRLQTATYALLVEATTGRRVDRCVLVALGPSGATEVEIPDLEAARQEVRRLVADTGRQLA